MDRKMNWKIKILLLMVGFLLAMIFFPKEDTAVVDAESPETTPTAVSEDVAYESDFFSDYRLKRAAWRDREEETLKEIIANSISEDARDTASADLMTLLWRIETEDMVEEVLKGRKYKDAIFVIDDRLNLLIIKEEDFSAGEQEALIQFAAAAAGIDTELISFFTIE